MVTFDMGWRNFTIWISTRRISTRSNKCPREISIQEFYPQKISPQEILYLGILPMEFCPQEFYRSEICRFEPRPKHFFFNILFYLFWTSVMHWYAKFLRADFLFWITGRFTTCKIPAGKIPKVRFPWADFHGQISGVLIFCGQNSCMQNSYGYNSK